MIALLGGVLAAVAWAEEPAPVEPAPVEPAPVEPAPRAEAVRRSDAALAVGPAASFGSGYAFSAAWRAAPGRSDTGASPGGLGIESRSFAYLGRGNTEVFEFASGYAAGLVVVPWAGGAVKPFATVGPATHLTMDLDIGYTGVTAAWTVDAFGAVGADLLFGERRRWGLVVEAAVIQPVVHVFRTGDRARTIGLVTVGLRLPRSGGRLDRWAAHLPDFGG